MAKYSVKEFFDKDTSTFTYIVYDPITSDAVVIDPVWNYNSESTELSCESIKELTSFIESKDLTVKMLMETHVHADHISAASELKALFPSAQTAVTDQIIKVQKTFASKLNLESIVSSDGSQFDILFEDQKEYFAGSISFKVINTPGHTPACTCYLFEDKLFTGDSIFMPDFGTGRCDFPMGSSSDLFDSITKKIYSLPDDTKIYVGHDYMPGGRELRFMTTVGEQKKNNIHVKEDTVKEDFMKMRDERDAKLNEPKLLIPSITMNINAGKLIDDTDEQAIENNRPRRKVS